MYLDSKHSLQCLIVAIQRKYELVRRQWLMEEKENSTELLEEKAKINKYRARRNHVSVLSFASNEIFIKFYRNFITEVKL